MPQRVKKVEWISDYKLKIQFISGEIAEVDLAHILKHAKNMFFDLKDIEFFKQVSCDGYTIYWPNGIDICPDLLYSMVQTKKKIAQAPHSRKKTKLKTS